MSIIKKILPWLSAILFTVGCAAGGPATGHSSAAAPSSGQAATSSSGQVAAPSSSQVAAPSSSQIAVSSFEETNTSIPKSAFNRMMGDTLYYLTSTWDEQSRELTDSSIYRLGRTDTEPEILTDFGNGELLLFFTDEQESVYCLYAMSGDGSAQKEYFFRKLGPDGEVSYDIAVAYQGTPAGQGVLSRFQTVAAGEADGEGRVCLTGTQGDLYLFDGEGQLVRISSAPWTGDSYNGSACGLVNAGKDGIYTYLIQGKKLSLQKVDMASGTLGSAIEVPTADMADASLALYNGYSSGLLLSDSSALWKYDFSGKSLTRLLGWGDSTVDLKNYIINAIGILGDGSLYIAAHLPGQDMALVSVAGQDISSLSQKQTAVLARIKMFEDMQPYLERMASEYNRQSTEYQVELRSYDSLFDLEAELLKGEGPDLFSLGIFGLDVHPLACQNVLEDLSPYFAKSGIVKEDDLLPAIRTAGTFDGKFLCVIPTFAVYGSLVGKGVTEGGLWTAEDYIALAEAHPDIPLEFSSDPKYYHSTILESAIKGDMERYVDWEAGKCYFDSESFISLLERISRLTPPGGIDADYSAGIEAKIDRISKGQELTSFWSVENNSALKHYLDAIENGASIELTGYPCQGPEPYYELFTMVPLGMNSASGNKEAAWSFLEYLLSQGQQATDYLPARQDAFDSLLEREKDSYGRDTHLSGEAKAFLKEITAGARWTAASHTTDILYIISEEASAVWAGDKTARQAAEIIQNRVQLYLGEQRE